MEGRYGIELPKFRNSFAICKEADNKLDVDCKGECLPLFGCQNKGCQFVCPQCSFFFMFASHSQSHDNRESHLISFCNNNAKEI
jgi:hypothetical protein